MAEETIVVGEQDTNKNAKRPDVDPILDKRQAEIEKMYKTHAVNFTPIVFSIVIAALIYLGWKAELENYMTPESGLGYALGIIGGTMMLVMLLYSLRKRAKWMRGWWAIRYWFRIHMILGIIGPMLILFHCNFQLGSQNSNIALFSMLLVVASGIIGRYAYGRIHFGLYGGEMTLKQLEQDQLIARYELSRLLEVSPQLYKKIKKYDDVIQNESKGLMASFIQVWRLSFQTRTSFRRARRMLIKACHHVATEEGWERNKIEEIINSGTTYLNAHYMTIRRIAGFAFFERLFALWHILHVPLFYMLVFTAVIHIIAVHMF
jgi:hypothetical protein